MVALDAVAFALTFFSFAIQITFCGFQLACQAIFAFTTLSFALLRSAHFFAFTTLCFDFCLTLQFSAFGSQVFLSFFRLRAQQFVCGVFGVAMSLDISLILVFFFSQYLPRARGEAGGQ